MNKTASKCRKCDHFHTGECHYRMEEFNGKDFIKKSCNCRENKA